MTTNGDTPAATARHLVEALSTGDGDALRSLFAGPADIDDPFHGNQVDGGFDTLVHKWRPVQGAEVVGLETTHSTHADGFVATELTLRLERDGRPVTLAIVVVNELAEDGRIVRSRLYYRRAHIDGQQHFRDRMLQDEIDWEFTPILERYQRALFERDTDEFIATFAEDGYFDGHGGAQDLTEHKGMGLYRGHAELRQGIGQMMSLGKAESPTGRLEHTNAFTDGVTTVLEFNILRPEICRVHAGVACYEVDPASGLLRAARVYDEAW